MTMCQGSRPLTSTARLRQGEGRPIVVGRENDLLALFFARPIEVASRPGVEIQELTVKRTAEAAADAV